MANEELLLCVEESDSSVGFYDPNTGEEHARIEVGSWPHEVEIHGDRAYVSNFGVKDYDERIGSPGASISVIDLKTLCEIDRLYTFRNPSEAQLNRAPHGLGVRTSTNQLFVNVESNDRMLVYDLDDDSRCPRSDFAAYTRGDSFHDQDFPVANGTHNFKVQADGKYLWVASGPNGLRRATLGSDGRPEAQQDPQNKPWPHSSVRGLAFAGDNRTLYAFCRNEILVIDSHDAHWQRSLRVLNNDGQGYGVGQFLYGTIHPKRPWLLVPAVWESSVLVIDADSGALLHRILVDLDPIHVILNGRGDTAFVSHGRSKAVIKIDLCDDVRTWRVSGRIHTKGGPNGIRIVRRPDAIPNKTLRFAACLPLSGPNSAEGREIRMGYELWRERCNAAGGISVGGAAHRVEIDYRDTQSLASSAKELTEELIAGGAQFMFGNYPTPENLAAGEVADRHGVPFVTATGAGSIIYEKNWRHVFGIMTPARLYLAGSIDAVASRLAASDRSVTIVSCSDPAAREDALQTAKYAQTLGFGIVVPDPEDLAKAGTAFRIHEQDGIKLVTYPHQHTEFTELCKLYQQSFPGLGLLLHTGHLNEAMALAESAYHAEFSPRAIAMSVGPSLARFRAELARRGVPTRGLFGASQWTPVLNHRHGHDPYETPSGFAEAFFERYSAPASYFSAGAMACGLVYEQAFRRAGSTEQCQVRDALAQTDFSSFFADIRLADDTQPPRLNSDKPIHTIQIQTEHGQEVETLVEPSLLWPFTWGGAGPHEH